MIERAKQPESARDFDLHGAWARTVGGRSIRKISSHSAHNSRFDEVFLSVTVAAQCEWLSPATGSEHFDSTYIQTCFISNKSLIDKYLRDFCLRFQIRKG